MRIIPAMGHIPLWKLQPMHLIEFYSNLEEDGMRLDGRYKAKQKLIDIIHNSGCRKGYASFVRATGTFQYSILLAHSKNFIPFFL